MSKFTNAEINAAMNKALDEKGQDYIYAQPEHGCSYAVGGERSCIVGHVLFYLDEDMFNKVVAWEESPHSSDLTFDQVAADLELPFDDDQVAALRNAQIDQDNGTAWGAAAVTYAQSLGEVL